MIKFCDWPTNSVLESVWGRLSREEYLDIKSMDKKFKGLVNAQGMALHAKMLRMLKLVGRVEKLAVK